MQQAQRSKRKIGTKLFPHYFAFTFETKCNNIVETFSKKMYKLKNYIAMYLRYFEKWTFFKKEKDKNNMGKVLYLFSLCFAVLVAY